MTDANTLPPLSLPQLETVGATPFAGDLMSRQLLAERLTGYIDRLRNGAVLAIHAPWGEGKTWFGKNWAKDLGTKGHKVLFIDAFQQDYIEEPFLLLSAEISSLLDDGAGAGTKLRHNATSVMKAILPIGAKVLIDVAGRLALGSSNLTGKIETVVENATSTAADASSKWIEDKLADHAAEQETLNHFRAALQDFANQQPKPILVFIDELDRCRPTFAVRLIERIKHFFDVPNLVFVLMLNQMQLEAAVKGVYGAETDASAYLSKFVNLFFHLPKYRPANIVPNQQVERVVSDVRQKYNLGDSNKHQPYLQIISTFATLYDLSLRDIERAFALYSLAQPISAAGDLLAYLISLKIKRPDFFRGFINGNIRDCHKEAREFLEKRCAEFNINTPGIGDYLRLLIEIHETCFTGQDKFSDKSRSLFHQFYGAMHTKPCDLFMSLARRIDLPVTN